MNQLQKGLKKLKLKKSKKSKTTTVYASSTEGYQLKFKGYNLIIYLSGQEIPVPKDRDTARKLYQAMLPDCKVTSAKRYTDTSGKRYLKGVLTLDDDRVGTVMLFQVDKRKKAKVELRKQLKAALTTNELLLSGGSWADQIQAKLMGRHGL